MQLPGAQESWSVGTGVGAIVGGSKGSGTGTGAGVGEVVGVRVGLAVGFLDCSVGKAVVSGSGTGAGVRATNVAVDVGVGTMLSVLVAQPRLLTHRLQRSALVT